MGISAAVKDRQPSPRFQGAWIASVANIDWPTAAAVGNDSLQRQQMIFLLDSLHSIGINAIIFQVRPTSDALYCSELEPWSHWLTGCQGSSAHYDPLEFVVKQAHLRNMEVHAWLNPYRVNLAATDISTLTHNHPLRLHPDWFWKYGKQWYFNPALPQTRDWICMVVQDIVARYDIDAIHMDDYFYPYPIAGQTLPDAADFQRDSRGFTDIKDWRRDNVNLTVKAIASTIRATKPSVQFGISPFGVYKDGKGLTNYHDLYADVIYWIEQGWVDYIVPQLYWHIGNASADYAVLAQWWATAVQKAAPADHPCQLYIGLSPYRLGGKNEADAWKNGNEIARQLRMNRTISGIDGECFYSTRPLLRNPLHVCDSIKSFNHE
ncbi:MAG: family 10 glycosylhydrolase [Paludibacteraceae bacterium]|nr:family 10 glycosylhydrolase [Paludibacteraceae bacterium]